MGIGYMAPRILKPHQYMEMSGQLHTLPALFRRKQLLITHWIGVCVITRGLKVTEAERCFFKQWWAWEKLKYQIIN